MSRLRRVLVTGGAGFIGSHLCDRLIDEGAQVVCIDDFNDAYDPAEKRRNIARHANHAGFELVEADIRDGQAMRELVAKVRPSAIAHLAARAGVRPSVADPILYQNTNVLGTLNLLDAARRAKVPHFVFASSSSVYGVNDKVPFAEDDCTHSAVSPYAATKIAGEALCNTFSHLYSLPVVSLRFFTVYGPRQRPDLAIRKFIELIRTDQSITLFGDGSSSRDYTYVDDIIQGVMAALRYELTDHQVFNLGNSTPVKLSELVAAIENAMGTKARIERGPQQAGDVPRTYASVDRAAAKLGYTPTTPLEIGLQKMLAWVEQPD